MVRDVSGSMMAATDAASTVGNDIDNSFFCSVEQIYSPVVIKKSQSVDGGFELPSDSGQGGRFEENHLGPTRHDLDPYFAKVLDGDDWIEQVDFQMMVNNSSNGDGQKDLNIRKVDRSAIDSVQVTHFRGPLIMSGWGFDLGDRPVPIGNDASSFDDNVVNDRSKWKSGPVDLKWDDERKVWSTGPQVVCGVASSPITPATSPCDPSTFTMKVLRMNTTDIPAVTSLSNSDSQETITVTNRDPSLEQADVSNTVFVMAIRVNYEWLPLWVGCPTETAESTCIT